MARPKEFDPDATLDAAVELFWTKGYANTSMQDLVEVLGVNRASLYATYGTKHDLFIAALSRYCGATPPALTAMLEGDEPVLPRVRSLLIALTDRDLDDPRRRGCFLVNSTVETVPHDPAAGAVVDRTIEAMRTAFADALATARATGEISARVDPADGATFILTTLQGLRVLTRTSLDRSRLHAAIDLALAALH